jgi:VIT1/CCC1 family predicted Fe2+/Mn2+ transporter
MTTLSTLLLRPADAPARPVSSASLNQLRAGVLGANDGVVSIAATVVGVAGAAASPSTIALAGGAALVAGALSMAAGEYASVSSQRDAERVAAAGRSVAGADDEAEFTNPWHAAVASLVAFTLGGLLPLLVVIAPWGVAARVPATFAAVVVALVVTGWASSRFTGASGRRSVLRNVVAGSIAMAVTYGLGVAFGGVL